MVSAIIVLVGVAIGSLLAFFVQRLIAVFSEETGKKAKKSFNQEFRAATGFYLAVIGVSAGLTYLSCYMYGATLLAALALLFCAVMVVLSFVDLRLQILPDILTKPLIILGLIQGYFGVFTSFKEALWGAVLGYGILWLVNFAFVKIRKKQGMGHGDFKLLGAIGAWVGPEQLVLIIPLSAIIGLIFALVTLAGRLTMASRVPFGPALAIAGVLSLFFGHDILMWYLRLF